MLHFYITKFCELFQGVLDHETWVMNLREANHYDYPIWYKLYTARAAYAMASLLPMEWDRLLEKLPNDQPLFDLYYKYLFFKVFFKNQADLQLIVQNNSNLFYNLI